MKTIVLGAGIVGTATAYYLAKKGVEVEVVERQADAALETSMANGGVIHVSEVQPWAQPGMPLKIIKWLGQEDAPLLLRYSAIPKMWRWGLSFARNCSASRSERNSLTNLGLAALSLRSMQEIRREVAIDYDLGTGGVLKIYRDMASLEGATSLSREWAKHGLEFERLSVAEAVVREPSLEPTAHTLVGALCFPGEEIGDPKKFTQGLARQCEKLGVKFHFNTEVRGLKQSGGKIAAVSTLAGDMSADNYVVAMGSFSPILLKTVGVHVSIYPVKGVTITVDGAKWPGRPRMAVIDDKRLFGLVPIGDRLRVSGSAEIAGYDPDPNLARCAAIIKNVVTVFPKFADCYDVNLAKHWAGLRPVSASGIPYVGQTAISNLFVNSGHGHCGWTMGAGSGRIAADLVTNAKPDIDVTGFTPATHC